MILKSRAKVRITYFNIYVLVNTKEIITDDKNATISSQLTNLNDDNIDILSVLNIIILLDIAKIEYFNIENQHNRNSTRLNLIFYYVKYTKLVFLQFFLKWTLSYLFSRKHFVQINIEISNQSGESPSTVSSAATHFKKLDSFFVLKAVSDTDIK